MRLSCLVVVLVSCDASLLLSAGRAMSSSSASGRAVSSTISCCSSEPNAVSSPATATSDDALGLHRALSRGAEADTSLGRAIKHALAVLTDAFRLYGPTEVVTSFNGGKDAVVILHLARAALAAHNEGSGSSSACRLRIIFFEMDEEFPEVDAFVRDTIRRFDLDLTSYTSGFSDGLRQCIATHGSRAFVLGTRSTDPNAKGQ